MRRRFLFVAVIGLLTLIDADAAGRVKLDGDVYFLEMTAAAIFPRILHLSPSGCYQRYAQGLRSGESDSGRWSQAQDGWITLSSDTRFREIHSSPVTVSMADREGLEELAVVKQRIRVMLQGDRREFTRAEIEELPSSWGTTLSGWAFRKGQEMVSRGLAADRVGVGCAFGDAAFRVCVGAMKTSVTREQLGGLLGAIEAFEKDEKKNEERWVAVRGGEDTYLVSDGSAGFGAEFMQGNELYRGIDRERALRDVNPEELLCR